MLPHTFFVHRGPECGLSFFLMLSDCANKPTKLNTIITLHAAYSVQLISTEKSKEQNTYTTNE